MNGWVKHNEEVTYITRSSQFVLPVREVTRLVQIAPTLLLEMPAHWGLVALIHFGVLLWIGRWILTMRAFWRLRRLVWVSASSTAEIIKVALHFYIWTYLYFWLFQKFLQYMKDIIWIITQKRSHVVKFNLWIARRLAESWIFWDPSDVFSLMFGFLSLYDHQTVIIDFLCANYLMYSAVLCFMSMKFSVLFKCPKKNAFDGRLSHQSLHLWNP